MTPKNELNITTSPLSISVAGRAGHAFAPPAMLKGFEAHARGVELLVTEPDRVVAQVRGPRKQTVHLHVVDGRLILMCSCPSDLATTPDPCRHAWAALLEIDRQGALDRARTRRGHMPVVTKPHSPPAKPKSRKR